MQAALQEDAADGSVRVVNVAGAGGTIGLAQFINAGADRGDALLVTGLIMVGAVLTNRSAVTLEATTPIARLTGDYELLVVPADSPYDDLAAFLDAWKRNPGALAIAGGSAAGTDHIWPGCWRRASEWDIVHNVTHVPQFRRRRSRFASILAGRWPPGDRTVFERVGAPSVEAGRPRARAGPSPAPNACPTAFSTHFREQEVI